MDGFYDELRHARRVFAAAFCIPLFFILLAEIGQYIWSFLHYVIPGT